MSAKISQTAREVIRTLCPLKFLRNLNILVSINKFPSSPRAVKQQVTANKMYVTHVMGMLTVTGTYVEFD